MSLTLSVVGLTFQRVNGIARHVRCVFKGNIASASGARGHVFFVRRMRRFQAPRHPCTLHFLSVISDICLPKNANVSLIHISWFFRFLVDCAKDPRFNSDTLMNQIVLSADLSWIDKQIYRYILIPITKKRLLQREGRFAWIYQHGQYWPEWGRGRDDAMNLTKYFLTTSPLDDTLGPTDAPDAVPAGRDALARRAGGVR